MKVKVCLECKYAIDLSQAQQDEAFFLAQFDSISLKEAEPECPFCGKLLEKEPCSCNKFKKAYDKLIATYSEQNLIFVANDDVSSVRTFPLKKYKLIITRVPLTDDLILLFNKGTIASSTKGIYFVSEGNIERKDLKFYVRKKKEVYECFVRNLEDIPQEAKIRLCKNVTKRVPEIIVVNNNQKSKRKAFVAYSLKNHQEMIAKFSISEFLESLQKLMKDE